MIIQFKNRKKELQELARTLNSKRFHLFVLYGRRRVGKTELILNATKNKDKIYYLASGENNLERFYNTCSKHNKEVLKLKKDWEVLFDFLKNKTEVVIIDEFQNMIKEDKNILNIFQAIVDTTLKNSNLKLFLLGSSVSIITSKILSYKSPLYGRRSGSLNLKSIPFFELSQFFPNTTIEQLLEIYGFADGIPYYLIKVDQEFWQWLEKELQSESTFLKDEVDFLVKYEFEDASTYKLVLEAIANGKTKLNEIKNFIKVKRTDITPYLKNLIEVGFIKRQVPITENIKSRKGRYFISDNFLKFWFRFIYPNLSSLEEGIFNQNLIKKNYNTYLGNIFENVCKEFLINTKPIEFTKIDKWWEKDKEIDLIATNSETKQILFVECKWKDKVNAEKILRNLKEKAKFVNWKRDSRKESYCIIARSFRNKPKSKDCFLFDLESFKKLI